MLLKLSHKRYSKLLKVFTNVIQIDSQALLKLTNKRYLKVLQMLFRFIHKRYSN